MGLTEWPGHPTVALNAPLPFDWVLPPLGGCSVLLGLAGHRVPNYGDSLVGNGRAMLRFFVNP